MSKLKWIEKLDDVVETAPVCLDWDDLLAINKLVGRNIQTKEDLLAALKHATSISVNGVEVTLEPGLITRLKSRCIRQDFDKFLHDRVIEWAHAFVGW